MASGGGDFGVRVWSVEREYEQVACLEGHRDYVRAVAFSPDNTHLASGSADKTIRVWSVRNNYELVKCVEGVH